MPERREGFVYIKSDLLKQEIAFSTKTGWVYCQDKTTDGKLVSYSPEELEILRINKSVITPEIHAVKKIIGGTICDNNSAKSISSVKGNVQEEWNTELEIY